MSAPRKLGRGRREKPHVWSAQSFEALRDSVTAVDAISIGKDTPLKPGTLAVMRHLTAMMLGRRRKLRLRAYLTERFGEVPLRIDYPARPYIETQC